MADKTSKKQWLIDLFSKTCFYINLPAGLQIEYWNDLVVELQLHANNEKWANRAIKNILQHVNELKLEVNKND